MYAIESADTRGWRWLSGIFHDRADADAEVSSISPKSGVVHVVVQAKPERFPVFIIEEKGFNYIELGALLERLNSLEPRNDEDHVHFNVYALREPFKPEVPGRDEMGRILHWHITDSSMREPRASVFRAELHDVASDA